MLGLPLVNQPGTAFQYGVNIDWAGAIVERVSGLSLDQYFQTHIFEPLGVKDLRFFPTAEMKKRLAYMHQREIDGSLHVSDHLYRFALVEHDGPEDRFCSGGAGCFGSPSEYCSTFSSSSSQNESDYKEYTDENTEIIAVLLNNGTCPKTHTRLLKPETVNGIPLFFLSFFLLSLSSFPFFSLQN